MIEKNCISFWFPKLLELGITVPDTKIIKAEFDLSLYSNGEYEGKLISKNEKEKVSKVANTIEEFEIAINNAASVVGYPLFLRSGVAAAKRKWKNTCFVKSQKDLMQHVFNIVNWSNSAAFFGMPCDVWAVRQYINMTTMFSAWDEVPINIEKRVFVKNGKVQCYHNYHAPFTLEGNCSDPAWKSKLYNNIFSAEVMEMAERIARNFEGYWSIDFCLARSGFWHVIDMAQGKESFHWPGCPKSNLRKDTVFSSV